MEAGIQLSPDMVLVLVLLSATIGLFVSELVRIDIAAILVMVAIGLLGLGVILFYGLFALAHRYLGGCEAQSLFHLLWRELDDPAAVHAVHAGPEQ